MPVSVRPDVLALAPDEVGAMPARALLLGGDAIVLAADPDSGALIVARRDLSLGVIHGRPPARVVRDALLRAPGVSTWIAPPAEPGVTDQIAASLDGLAAVGATLHTLPSRLLASLRPDGTRDLRWLMAAEGADLSLVEPALRDEIARACASSIVAAAFDDGVPVSFCYAAGETERFWDVAVDTDPRARRRGFGLAVASFLIAHMRDRGKQAVWGAAADNAASLGLARRLGFEPAHALRVFTRPGH